MLNNRPIQQSGSIQDQAPLTPNSFVLGDLANAVFPPDFPEVTNLDRKLKQQIEVQKSVWKRFFLEFVPLLGPRQKWSQEQENLKVDEVVIELDENQPRGVWRLMIFRRFSLVKTDSFEKWRSRAPTTRPTSGRSPN